MGAGGGGLASLQVNRDLVLKVLQTFSRETSFSPAICVDSECSDTADVCVCVCVCVCVSDKVFVHDTLEGGCSIVCSLHVPVSTAFWACC